MAKSACHANSCFVSADVKTTRPSENSHFASLSQDGFETQFRRARRGFRKKTANKIHPKTQTVIIGMNKFLAAAFFQKSGMT
jgi:hypothetical protein